MKNIKWQIHAETSLSQVMLWVIIGKLFGGWVWLLAGAMIIGNLVALIQASQKLPKGYLREDK